MLYILELFSFSTLLLSFCIILSSSPIYAIIFLILIFCNTGFSLFFYNFDFFGLIFIIIYVGAIAVLFLFIIMMLNIKLKNNLFIKEEKNYFSKFSIFLLSLILGIVIGSILENVMNDDFLSLFLNKNNNILFFIDKFNNINVFGQYFYNFFNLFFILAGLILLVALIGAVVLTFDLSVSNKSSLKQLEIKQLSKSSNILAFY